MYNVISISVIPIVVTLSLHLDIPPSGKSKDWTGQCRYSAHHSSTLLFSHRPHCVLFSIAECDRCSGPRASLSESVGDRRGGHQERTSQVESESKWRQLIMPSHFLLTIHFKIKSTFFTIGIGEAKCLLKMTYFLPFIFILFFESPFYSLLPQWICQT